MKQETETPELPNGWEWQGGSRGTDFYTTNFGTEYEMGGPYAGEYGMGGFMGQVTWDEGRDHLVELIPIESFDGDDPVFGYAVSSAEFESEQEALNAIPELIEHLKTK